MTRNLTPTEELLEFESEMNARGETWREFTERAHMWSLVHKSDGELVPSQSRGVKRQLTPDSKPRAVPATKFCKTIDLDKTSTVGLAAEPEPICQVCRVGLSEVKVIVPLLLNACGEAVKVPGRFCSPECYQHV